MKNFHYFSPRNLSKVLALFEKLEGKNIFLMAGGTDLFVRMKNGEIHPDCIIDLKAIPGLDFIGYDDDTGLKIGALSTIADIENNPTLPTQYASLAEAASKIGSVQIRNKGTIGGNLCNASPSADLAPPLIVMDATVRIFSKTGERIFRMEDFFLDPGKTVMQKGEVLIEVQVPKLPLKSATSYLKLSRREGMDLAIVGVACFLVVKAGSCCEQARIAMGAVAPKPLRAREAETFLVGKEINSKLVEEVAKKAATAAKPISDIRATADYRREMIRILVKRAIKQSLNRIGLRV